MRRFLVICFLMASALMSISAQTADDTPANHETMIFNDSLAADMDATDQAVPDTVTSSEDISRQLEGQLTGPVYLPKNLKRPDFYFFKSITNPGTKPYTFLQDQSWAGVPMFVAGLIAKNRISASWLGKNLEIQLSQINYGFHSKIDDYTQYLGYALTAGLKLAGVEGRSDWPRMFASSLASCVIMAGLVNGIKYTANEVRPNGLRRNSWPSGHSATAFVGATILHKEYGLTRSPWYSIAGYSVATATGVMRILNNSHWISDVMSGAGIGILSTELAYGICDLLFKRKGLLMNDLGSGTDMREKNSFFSISLGMGLGNNSLVLASTDGSESLRLRCHTPTVAGVEGAWFFSSYVGIGGRMRAKFAPVKEWDVLGQDGSSAFLDFMNDPGILDFNKGIRLTFDHFSEYTADAGVYFCLPLSSRFAIGSKLLMGCSFMGDVDAKALFEGVQAAFRAESLDHEGAPMFIKTDDVVSCEWDYLHFHASNSMKFGTGLSFSCSTGNSMFWQLFFDYDYSAKTFVASYHPYEFFSEVSPAMADDVLRVFNRDMTQPMMYSACGQLHQWVAGGALCVSF